MAGYEPYNTVASVNGLVHLGCMAHARRYLVEAEAALPKATRPPEHPATQLPAAIGELYAIEARWPKLPAVALESAEQAYALRHRLRQEHSGPRLARASPSFYLYDLGDGWEHRVTVEKFLPPEPGPNLPQCLAGANACPPENVGGPPGYAGFLEAIRDPAHEEHAAMLEWCGGAFDCAAFRLDHVNTAFRELKLYPSIRPWADAYGACSTSSLMTANQCACDRAASVSNNSADRRVPMRLVPLSVP